MSKKIKKDKEVEYFFGPYQLLGNLVVVILSMLTLVTGGIVIANWDFILLVKSLTLLIGMTLVTFCLMTLVNMPELDEPSLGSYLKSNVIRVIVLGMAFVMSPTIVSNILGVV